MERIAEEALNSPALTEYPAYKAPMGRSMALLGKLGLPPKSSVSEGVAIPEVRQVADYASGWDDSITSQYQSAYKHGYIATREPEPPVNPTSSSPLSTPIKRSRSRSSRRSVLKQSTTITSPVSSSTPGRRGRSANKKGTSSTPSHSRAATRLASPPEESPSTHVRPTKSSRLWQHFHPTRWTQVEIEFAQVLQEIFGSDWFSISRYMCRTKSPAILERAFKRCDGDFRKIEATTFNHLQCEVCKLEARLAEAVFCDSCYRSYHLMCTYPVLDQIPETDWFCSSHCSKLGTLNCKTCRKATDDNLILVCDKCERGAHMYCLAEPLKEIPEGEWFCDECASTATPRSSATTQSKQSNSNTARMAARNASRAQDVIHASKECNHEHGVRMSASGIDSTHSSARRNSSSSSASTQTPTHSPATPSSNNSLNASGTSTIPTQRFLETRIDIPPVSPLAYLLLSYAVDIPWREMVYLSQICIDCLIEQDGGVIPRKMGDFAPGHALLPQNFKYSIFANQVDDIPFTSSGDLPDPAAINAHLDTLLMAADAAVNRSISKPYLAHNTPIGYTPPPAPSLTVAAPRTPNARSLATRNSPAGSLTSSSAPITPHSKPVISSSTAPEREPRVRRAAAANTASILTPARVRSPSGSRSRNRSRSNTHAPIGEWLAEGGYGPSDQCYWIFQANPGLYDINASLKHIRTMTWVVRQNQSRIRKGDRVFVWESGKDSGLIALGTILTDPSVSRESPAMKPFAKDPSKFDRPDVRCQIEIEHVMPSKLRRADVASDPGLTNLTILRAPIGTNFKVTKPEANCILNRLSQLHPSNVFKSTANGTSSAASSSTAAASSAIPSSPYVPKTSKAAEVTQLTGSATLSASTRSSAKRSSASAPTTPLTKSLNLSSSSTIAPTVHDTSLEKSDPAIDGPTPAYAEVSSSAMSVDVSESSLPTLASVTKIKPDHSSFTANGFALNGSASTLVQANGVLVKQENGSLNSSAMAVDEETSDSLLAQVKAHIDRSRGSEGLHALKAYDDPDDSEYLVNSSMEVSDISISEDSSTDSDSTPRADSTALDEPVSEESNFLSATNSLEVESETLYEDAENGAEMDDEAEKRYEEDAEVTDEESDEELDEEDEEGEEEEDDEEEIEEDEDTADASVDSAPSSTNGASKMDLDTSTLADSEAKTLKPRNSTSKSNLSNNHENGYSTDDSDGAATDRDVPTDSEEDDDDGDGDGDFPKVNGPSEVNAAGLTRNRQKLLEINDPTLSMRFPLKLVQSAVVNSRRMRLSVHIGSSVLIAVSGGRELKKKSTGKIPLVPVQHASAVHTYVAKTPGGGWKFKLAPTTDDEVPSCPSCTFPLMKSPTVSCNDCGRVHHAHCAVRVKGGSSPASLSGAPPTALNGSQASMHSSNGLSNSSTLTNGNGVALAHAADFTCSSCLHHPESPTCGKCRRVVRSDYFSCDSCDEPYHLSCFGLKQAPQDTPWLCHRCDIPKAALMRLKLAFVLRELRLEVLRLTTACIDIGASRLRRCIESPDKAGSPINTLSSITDAARSGCALIAQQALERWNIYRANAKIDFVD